MHKTNIEEINFLIQSNYLAEEYSDIAFEDAFVAWEYLKKQKEFTIENLLTTHLLLMRRLNKKIAGNFRTCDVFIGGKRKPFISVDSFRHQLGCLFYEITKNLYVKSLALQNKMTIKSQEIEKIIKKHHINFENIHPFEDGNGRIGRMLYNAQALQNNLPVKVFYENEKDMYYRWFEDEKHIPVL